MSVLRYARENSPSTGRAIVLENGADTAVRDDRYTYIRNADGTPELYDNAEDPFELESLAGKKAAATLEARLKARLEALEACAGEACRARTLRISRTPARPGRVRRTARRPCQYSAPIRRQLAVTSSLASVAINPASRRSRIRPPAVTR